MPRVGRASTRVDFRRRSPRLRSPQGTSLLEALVVVALLGIVSLFVAPGFTAWRQRTRLEAAARRLTLESGRACAFAAASGRTHGLMLEAGPADLVWSVIADGDGDGLSMADVDAGVDAAVVAAGRLATEYPGVLPGRPAGVPTISGGASGTHGVAFGTMPIVSCSAEGGARAGTVYLRSSGGDAAAMRVYGPTARLSLWWWEAGSGAWARMR